MDITFRTSEGQFNYRVTAVAVQGGKLLAMRSEKTPYYFLPGGRVTLGERAEDALLREIREELGVEPRLVRLLWMVQSFFTEDVSGEKFHEVNLYFLVDLSHTDLVNQGDRFYRQEGKRIYELTWLPVESLREQYFYPLFLKERILDLPQMPTLLTEIQ